MKIINKIYINGQFISPIGQDVIDLINPSNKEVIGRVTLGNELDTRAAVAAAKAAFITFSKSSIIERGQILQRLHDAIIAKSDTLNTAAVAEYGAPITATAGRTEFAAKTFLLAKSSPCVKRHQLRDRRGSCRDSQRYRIWARRLR
jgi:aldehyde dehydrogenase (NAD+)